jgi:hypothetical protein
MKSLRDYIESEPLLEGSIEVNEQSKPEDPPAIMVMRRKSIRQFPNGQRVALYFIDKLKKYVTVPYDDMQLSLTVKEYVEDFPVDVLTSIYHIALTNESKRISFDDGSSIKVSSDTATNIINMHESLNDENKQKVSEMIQESKHQFLKVVDFAKKHVN